MAGAFEFTLNGKPVRVEAVSPNTTLLEFLRGSGLTGSKEGCAEGDCGACSVAIIERDGNGKAAYRAVNSCLMPVCLLAGREVVSVEGVGCSKQMHPVQRTMAEGYGAQCGYCTPGFVMSVTALLKKNFHPTAADVKHACAGNLCRCGAHPHILQAALKAAGVEHTSKTEIVNYA